MIISVDAEKAFVKILIKSISKLGIEGNFFNTVKNIYEEHIPNIILNGERLLSHKIRGKNRYENGIAAIVLRFLKK